MVVFSQVDPPAHKMPMSHQDYILSDKLSPNEQEQDVNEIFPLQVV